MAIPKKVDKILVWITSLLFLFGLIGAFTFKETRKPIQIDLLNQPTVGNLSAPVEVVIFSDFMCNECQYFATQVFPKLDKEFIQTGKIKFKSIPIAFLPYSKQVTRTALCLYFQNHENYWSFSKMWYQHRPEFHVNLTLKRTIQNQPNLQKAQFNECTSGKKVANIMNNNLQIAEKMILPSVEVPTVFVNGKRAPSYTYETLKGLINSEIQKVRL